MGKPWVPYVVQQGDHLDKIAFRFGVDADRLWSNAKNQDLAARRRNRNTLYPGDVLFVPSEPCAGLDVQVGTSNSYTAVVPTVPIRLKIEAGRRAIGGKKFEVDGARGPKPIEGTASAEGEIAFEVPVWVREVVVRVPDVGIVLPLHIGDLDPIDEISGITQRLQNLGYLSASLVVGATALAHALRAFQRHQGLTVTGEIDSETRSALEQQHEGGA